MLDKEDISTLPPDAATATQLWEMNARLRELIDWQKATHNRVKELRTQAILATLLLAGILGAVWKLG